MFVDHEGTLVLIGGAEKHKGEFAVLRKVVSLCGDHGNMLVVPVAAQDQQKVGSRYQKVFSSLGLKDTEVITMTHRSEANSPRLEGMLRGAAGVFFTGGDQMRITDMLRGTGFGDLLEERYRAGITLVAGTSAGASAMCQIMISGEEDNDSPLYAATHMGYGLGLLQGAVVDQHFAQRGRIGRLLSAIAQNPEALGLGLDEDTAAIVRLGREMEVFGSGDVTIVDALSCIHCNLSEASLGQGQPLALSNVVLHVLPAGYRYDLRYRTLLMRGG